MGIVFLGWILLLYVILWWFVWPIALTFTLLIITLFSDDIIKWAERIK